MRRQRPLFGETLASRRSSSDPPRSISRRAARGRALLSRKKTDSALLVKRPAATRRGAPSPREGAARAAQAPRGPQRAKFGVSRRAAFRALSALTDRGHGELPGQSADLRARPPHLQVLRRGRDGAQGRNGGLPRGAVKGSADQETRPRQRSPHSQHCPRAPYGSRSRGA